MPKIWEILSEIVFPSSLTERKIRRMNLGDFNTIKEVSFSSESKVLSFFKYKNPLVKETIGQIKYKRNGRLTKIFAEIVYSELLEEISDLSLFENFNNPILVPVPMSNIEKRERGYNQVELLVDEIVKISGGSLSSDFNLLRKIKNTKRQTELKREERLENIKGVFEIGLGVEGKNIILIDDVMTTEATINEAREILEHGGAKVFVVVMAN
ncbi:MAG TPA: hypothetical protein QGH03_01460 [Candidatus Paceibacterota bacterium]|jgi:ComF family protein|nr:hypothetical protein [Candidatus Paceibacterota bacterium]HJN62883.1 hypothetical protein [Candidatus Paceibacterota bacterium]|tara:strand:- start:1145 stop:1777 length:633 start_codon:yes stop_codon:yes gene_type:complete